MQPPAAAVQSAELTTTATDPVSSDASAAIDAQVAVPQGATEEAVVAPVATPVEGASNVVAEATESSPAPPPSGGGEAGVSALDGVGALAEMEAMKEALGEPGGNAAAIDEEVTLFFLCHVTELRVECSDTWWSFGCFVMAVIASLLRLFDYVGD